MHQRRVVSCVVWLPSCRCSCMHGSVGALCNKDNWHFNIMVGTRLPAQNFVQIHCRIVTTFKQIVYTCMKTFNQPSYLKNSDQFGILTINVNSRFPRD